MESLAGCQIRELALGNNKLQHLTERVFSSMATSLTSLDLSYNKLDSIPFAALKDLKNLKWINLQRNQIPALNGDWSHLKDSLANLFLGENDIKDIPSNANEHNLKNSHGLRQLRNLIWLNLDGNRISEIHKYSLPPNLQTLSISHNLMENFPLEVLTLPRLQWLYLRGNHIETFPEHTFSKKLWLEKIDLSENYLKTLPRLPFNNSAYVRDLNMAFNDLSYLVADSFMGLKCKRIILSYNQIKTLDKNTFFGIENHLEYLDFDHNNLLEIPGAINLLQSLKYLYLSSNFLNEIPEYTFTNFCSTLKALSLSGNRFTKIPTHSLLNCSKIFHFNIAYNDVYELNESDFTDWGNNIRTLILANNHFTNIMSEVFSNLKYLKELSLSFNPLRYIEPNIFSHLNYLESLDISFSLDNIEFPSEIFQPVSNLQWLTLDNNRIHIISNTALDSLPNLQYLNLEFNRLESIPSKLFKSSLHKTLRDVRFTFNEIRVIKSDTFHSLANLDVILLSYNKISHLQKNSFHHLPRLSRLILSHNLITHIDEQSFSGLPLLMNLDLNDNLLQKFSFNFFANVSSCINMNLSNNEITGCEANNKILNIEVLDLQRNKLENIPSCIKNIGSLRKLFLDYNKIPLLEQNIFMHLTTLEHLSVKQNYLRGVHRHAFFGLQNLQILDLSQNFIDYLHNNQFSTLPKLRNLNLSFNKLKYFPKDVFRNTALEMLELSGNAFSAFPSISLAEIGFTLRYISMSYNYIEHIDSTTFPDVPYLHCLNLSNNRLGIVPDNVFTGLSYLQKLDLSSNPLRANFKELFHFGQNLKELHLANIGATFVPHIILPNLIYLNLSHNNIKFIEKTSIHDLKSLNHLSLCNNQLTHIPTYLGVHMPYLKTLDISNNPIKEISSETFSGLQNLQNLNIQGLRNLVKFDSMAILQNKHLLSLSMQIWPHIENFSFELCKLLSTLRQLRILKLYIKENILSNQLLCLYNPKVRHLEISGPNLRSIESHAFSKLTKNPDLVIKITDTSVEELPAGLIANFRKIAHLTLDLRYNKLMHLSPETFYTNYSVWKSVGTTSIKGGLSISGNSFRCGCHLSWLGHWLRRWIRETMQVHNTPVESAVQMYDLLTQATCFDDISGTSKPIVQLPPEDMSCIASPLSKATNSNKSSVTFIYLLYTIFILS